MMPEQFQYPEQGWSTGKMRKAQSKYPELGQDEWNEWFRGLPSGGRIITPNKRSIHEAIKESPQGITVSKDHPGLKDLGDEYDIHSIPDPGLSDHLLIRPKPAEPLTS